MTQLFCSLIIVPLTHTNVTPTYKYVLQSIGLLLVTSVCISLTLGTKIRLALMGTTATEEEASRTLERASSGLDFRRTGQPSSSPSEQLSEGNSTQKTDDHVALLAKVDLLSAHNAVLKEQIKVLAKAAPPSRLPASSTV